MQNVPIKFRGKCVDSGEYVCGDLIHGEELITFKPDITAKAVIIKQINFFRNADENNVVFSNAFYPELANVWNLMLKK